MEESSIITSFFDNLSVRMRKENDLSDVTWSLCQASPFFYDYFIHFFFPELDVKEIVEFERERPDEKNGRSRVDFFIKLKNNEKYLIEVKIYDQNQHFGVYEEDYEINSDHLGYITNYPLIKKGYDKIRQWSELHDKLEVDLVSLKRPNEKSLIEGYLSYVKNVCNIIKFDKKMNLQNLYSMYELFHTLKKLTNRTTDDFVISFYGNNETSNGANFKFWFEINYRNSAINIPKDWGVIGFWYERKVPVFSVGFDSRDGWGKHIYSILKEMDSQNLFQDYQYCCKPYDDEGCMWIDIKEDVMKQIDYLSTIDEQEEVIRNFMDEALLIPIKKQ